MKKLYIYTLMTFLAGYTNTVAQVKFYNFGLDTTRANGGFTDIKQTLDTGYIIVNGHYLIKTNINGDTLSTKNYTYWGGSVSQTNDSGYIDVGAGLVRINKIGNPLWAKRYDGLVSIMFGSQTNDTGFVLAGTTYSFGAGGDDFFLVKTDSAGNPTWNKTYGGAGYDDLYSFQQTHDGGYIMSGATNSFSSGIYLIKINADGDTLWSKTYNIIPPNGGSNTSIQQTFDGGYIMTGVAGASSTLNIYLMKTDSMGNALWCKTYSYGTIDIFGQNVEQTTDSGYIILGDVHHSSTNSDDVSLMKTDKNGNLLWSNAWSLGNNTQLYSDAMHQTIDGGYILSVDFIVIGFGDQLDVIKTDSSGNSCYGTEYNLSLITQTDTVTFANAATIVTTFSDTVYSDTLIASSTAEAWVPLCFTDAIPESRLSSMSVYPNPVAPDGCISINLYEDLKGVEITIYNLMGEVLYSEIANGTGQTILLSLKGRLSSGMYFLRIRQGENICVQKIVVMG